MSESKAALVLVAPVFDEEAAVPEFLDRVFAIAPASDLRGVVIVDDGSLDGTCAAVRAFTAKRAGSGPRVRLVRMSRNFGHQTAVMAGMRAAIDWAAKESFGLVGLIDADLQDRPEDLPALVRATADADVAYATRARRSEGAFFRLGAAAFHWLIARTARFPIPRNAGTFSVMRLHAARAIVAESHQSPYFPAVRAWVGFRQAGVPLARDARRHGTSRVGVIGLIRLGATAIFSYSDLPLSFLVVASTLTFAGSVCAAILMVGLKLAGLVQVQGTALIIVSIFASLGVLSMQIALLAHALGRARAESSRSAGYVVMSDEADL